MTHLYHPDGTIPSDYKGWVWVFGSNLRGAHGAGAALVARQRFGAEYGVGLGLSGRSYAIPTKDAHLKTLDGRTIHRYITQFKEYSLEHPEIRFWVTAVGYGLAGYKHAQIAPLFVGCGNNCSFPSEWKEFLECPTTLE